MDLKRTTLHDAVVATGKSVRFYVGDLDRIALHAAIAGTATVVWYGSNKDDPSTATAGDWAEIDRATASKIMYTDAPIQWVYADVESWTSGAVTTILTGTNY